MEQRRRLADPMPVVQGSDEARHENCEKNDCTRMFHSKKMNFPLPGHAHLGPMAVVHVHARNSTLPYFEMSPPVVF